MNSEHSDVQKELKSPPKHQNLLSKLFNKKSIAEAPENVLETDHNLTEPAEVDIKVSSPEIECNREQIEPKESFTSGQESTELSSDEDDVREIKRRVSQVSEDASEDTTVIDRRRTSSQSTEEVFTNRNFEFDTEFRTSHKFIEETEVKHVKDHFAKPQNFRIDLEGSECPKQLDKVEFPAKEFDLDSPSKIVKIKRNKKSLLKRVKKDVIADEVASSYAEDPFVEFEDCDTEEEEYSKFEDINCDSDDCNSRPKKFTSGPSEPSYLKSPPPSPTIVVTHHEESPPLRVPRQSDYGLIKRSGSRLSTSSLQRSPAKTEAASIRKTISDTNINNGSGHFRHRFKKSASHTFSEGKNFVVNKLQEPFKLSKDPKGEKGKKKLLSTLKKPFKQIKKLQLSEKPSIIKPLKDLKTTFTSHDDEPRLKVGNSTFYRSIDSTCDDTEPFGFEEVENVYSEPQYLSPAPQKRQHTELESNETLVGSGHSNLAHERKLLEEKRAVGEVDNSQVVSGHSEPSTERNLNVNGVVEDSNDESVENTVAESNDLSEKNSLQASVDDEEEEARIETDKNGLKGLDKESEFSDSDSTSFYSVKSDPEDRAADEDTSPVRRHSVLIPDKSLNDQTIVEYLHQGFQSQDANMNYFGKKSPLKKLKKLFKTSDGQDDNQKYFQVDPRIAADDSSDNYDLTRVHRNPIYTSDRSKMTRCQEMSDLTNFDDDGMVSFNIGSQPHPPAAVAPDGRPLRWPKTIAQKSTRFVILKIQTI